ncbi:protein NLRC5 isoform X1 [Electrophorus electricus]|uniref:protein NLRC5 isoform X1 n=2 Tax=Electrophorus electricus TaxID=8005 RepID=UPI0015D0194B|nr:protein NLRC5 isoform X1 [Electrophorus electricus]
MPEAQFLIWTKMDDIDLEDDIRNVVTQEAAIIVDVLCLQRDNVLGRIYGLVERNTRERLEHLPNRRDSVLGILDYFKTSERNRCLHFLKTMWMFCENIPLELEIKVLSIAGWSFDTGMTTIHFADSEELPPSPSAKRACLDHVQIYTSYMRSFLQQKFERVTKDMAKKVCLDTMYLSLRQRGAARPRAQEGQEPGPDQRESAEWLLSTTGRVVVVLGLAGSGKTLLMHCLSHRWAEGLYPDIQLLFLLEFRQLNLVSQPLSLKELLFQFFLPPEGGEEQSEAVFSYILDNPQKVCFIFDGYDELGAKFTDPMTLGSTLDPCQRLPMADLLSGLCSYKILPGCTVLITCRPRDVSDLFGSSSCFVAELLGFSQQQVREYTEEFFQEKGDALKEKALSRMMGSRHLLSMSHVPALCHVCCVCLDHLLSGEVSQPAAQLPSSLTQIYLHILSAFLSHCEGSGSSLAATYLLQKYRTQIAELCKLAMDGLETSRIVFQAQDLSPQLMNFGANARILSRVDLTCPDGSRSLGCAFMHLTMQEFLAALHLMTSPDVSELKLKKKLNLKSRWIAKSDPRTVFTDSLHLYMCGLAAEACTSSLVVLEGGEEVRGVVQRRQAAVRRILLGFVGSASQTGPKIVELCRCAHETQDVNLAAAIGSRARFELRNIRLNPVDMDALAFVTSAASQMVCLDFGGCSIELECLNIIPNIKNLEHLIFRSRKYDDNFAEALSSILPRLESLKQLDFISGGLTDAGAAKLVTALESCLQITHLNVSDNSLSDESIRKITYLFPKLTNITSVMLGKNNISRDGIFILVEKMATFLNIKKVHVIGRKEINVFFSPNSHTPGSVGMDKSEDIDTAKELILNECSLRLAHLTSLCSKLKNCASLKLLNLSSNSLESRGLRKMLGLLPKLGTIQEINFSENEVDMEGIVFLSTFLQTQKDIREVHASHNGKRKLILKFNICKRDAFDPLTSDGSDLHLHKKFSLTQSEVQPAIMKRLCRNLVKCTNLRELDLSHGTMKYESIEKLLDSLPHMTSLHMLNLSHIQMSKDIALLFMRSLAKCQRITAVNLRPCGDAFIMFLQAKAQAATCKLTQYELNRFDVVKLSEILEDCQHLADLDLSSNSLRDEGVKSLVDSLPKLQISRSVCLNDNRLSQAGVVYLANSLSTCDKVAVVEVSLGAEERSWIHLAQENDAGKTLSLTACSFDASHLQQLLEILSSCPRELKLELSSTTLDSQSRQYLLSNLAQVSTVQTLELSNNGLNAEEITHLVKQLRGDYRTIRIEEPWIKKEAAVSLVASCLDLNPRTGEIRVEKTCFHLSFESHPHSEVSFENNCLSEVHSLSLVDCDVEGRHLSLLQAPIQRTSSLLTLQFTRLTVGREGAEFLASILPSLTSLRSLSLNSKGETLSKGVICALRRTQRQLQSLSLSHHVISDDAATALGGVLEGLTRVRSLNLSYCSGWTSAGGRVLVRGLVQCLSLEEIWLDSIQLDEESTVCLAQGLQNMTSIKKISISKMVLGSKGSSEVLSVLACLHSCTGLQEIDLQGLRIDDQGIEELVKCIPKWTKLSKINLSENCVRDQAGEKLVEALSHCRELQQLRLSRNKLGTSSAARLGRVLPSLRHLTELDLSENKVCSEGSLSLSQGLVSMKTLKILRLTSVGTSDLGPVAACLQHCTSIEDISLAWNECGNEVVQKLVEVLPQCINLRRLDLEANNINTSGAKTLATCLLSCPWIEVIRLWRNPIVKDDHILRDRRLNFSST